MKARFLLAALATCMTTSALAEMKVEDAIKWRQSAYSTMAWNMGRIKGNLEGDYKQSEVIQAANVIQAIANAGMGSLYVPGSEKGKGWKETRVKPELFTDGPKVGKIAGEFNTAANALAQVAASGDAAAVKAAFGQLGASCKSCHDAYRKD